jgi:hypothetical protein
LIDYKNDETDAILSFAINEDGEYADPPMFRVQLVERFE